MPGTNREIAEKVIAQASHYDQEPEMIFIPDVVALIQETIREMVMDVSMMGSQADRQLLQKNYNPPIVSVAGYDTVDLTAFLQSDADRMLLDLPFVMVRHDSSQSEELLYTPDLVNLTLQNLADGFDYYTVEGNTLYIYASPELTGNLSIRSFYVPQITALDDKFKPELISRLLQKMIVTRTSKR